MSKHIWIESETLKKGVKQREVANEIGREFWTKRANRLLKQNHI
ncbi:hypothetical protein [Staphylococcus haemolyticus]|nr:hypothetical protein [Staphylococcus haemolyticus]